MEAAALFTVGVTDTEEMLYATVAVYEVVALANCGLKVPEDKLRAERVASLDFSSRFSTVGIGHPENMRIIRATAANLIKYATFSPILSPHGLWIFSEEERKTFFVNIGAQLLFSSSLLKYGFFYFIIAYPYFSLQYAISTILVFITPLPFFPFSPQQNAKKPDILSFIMLSPLPTWLELSAFLLFAIPITFFDLKSLRIPDILTPSAASPFS
jgi:hypothetical protein